jgi:hypothetical protein
VVGNDIPYVKCGATDEKEISNFYTKKTVMGPFLIETI